jgi:ATP-dependent protease ClpP protease subunit
MAKRKTDPQSFYKRLDGLRDKLVDPKKRVIYLWGSVDRQLSFEAITALKLLDETPGYITVVLNSDGGDEYEGWAIHDAFIAAKNPVKIIGTGQVMSMAAILLQMTDRKLGRRWLTPNTRFMIHDGAQKVGEGKAAAHSSIVIACGREQEKNNARYVKRLADRSGLPFGSVRDMSLRETYMSAQEACDSGFADGLYFGRIP